MFTLLVFVGGVTVGMVYEKQLKKYKERAVAAATAAQKAFKEP